MVTGVPMDDAIFVYKLEQLGADVPEFPVGDGVFVTLCVGVFVTIGVGVLVTDTPDVENEPFAGVATISDASDFFSNFVSAESNETALPENTLDGENIIVASFVFALTAYPVIPVFKPIISIVV